MKLENKDFNYEEYTEEFIDSADNDDLESFIDQDFEESVKIESEMLKKLSEKDIRSLVNYMKKEAQNVLK
jgi:hypothetical protein